MMEYPCCPQCGVYAVNEKDKCFYCGAELKGTRFSSWGGQTLSTLKSLWTNGPWLKLKKRPPRILPIEGEGRLENPVRFLQ